MPSEPMSNLIAFLSAERIDVYNEKAPVMTRSPTIRLAAIKLNDGYVVINEFR